MDDRRLSTASGHSSKENPTQGLIPLCATDVFLQRFQSWAHIVKNLVTYFETIVEHERKLSELKTKMAKDMLIPQPCLFSDSESFQKLYADFIQLQTKQSQEHNSASEVIDSQILPILRSLLSEIRRKASDADREWSALDKEMTKDRETYIKLIGNLRSSLMRHQWKSEVASNVDKDVPKDPWLANMYIKEHASICLKKQSEYRGKLIEQKKTCAAFETMIYQNLKVALSLFLEWKTKSLTGDIDLHRFLKTDIVNINIEADWDLFINANPEILNQDAAPLIKLHDLTYDGYDDPLTKVIQEGVIYKKESGMFSTNWKSFTALLTGSGFFHLLNSASDKNSHGIPELSLDLSECSVGPLLLNDKEPEEFIITEKSVGIFGREVKHKVKGKNMEVSSKWWGLLSDHVRSIKKSIADQVAEQELKKGGASEERLSKVLQAPLQPSPKLSKANVSSKLADRRGLPSREQNSSVSSQKSNQVVSDLGEFQQADAIRTDTRREPPVPLPPRRPPPHSPPVSQAISFEAPQAQSQTYNPSEIPDVNPHVPAIPVAMQMELALKAAVDGSSEKAKKSSNPWDNVELEEDNVWS